MADRFQANHQDRIEQLNAKIEELKNFNNVQIAQLWKTISTAKDGDNKYSLARSCYEILMADPTVKSDNYYIDPDGSSVGEPPIQVFCDMSTGIILREIIFLYTFVKLTNVIVYSTQ